MVEGVAAGLSCRISVETLSKTGLESETIFFGLLLPELFLQATSTNTEKITLINSLYGFIRL